MTKLNSSEITHIAKLAKLTLNEDEVEIYKEQLSKIISYVDSLNEVDIESLSPTSQTTGLENVVREDDSSLSVFETLKNEEAISQAKHTHNGYFVVPAVFDQS